MSDYERLAALRGGWKAPRDLAGTMREVELTRTGIAALVFAGLLAVGAVAAGVGISRLAVSKELARRALDEQGIQTQGVITRVWRDRGGKGESHGMVAYEFPFEGRTYRGKSEVPQRTWRQLAEGNPIEVRFIPGDPDKNHPAAWRSSALPSWVGVPIALVFLGLAAGMWYSVRRQRALLSDGRPAPAIVTAHVRTMNGKYWRYEFALPGGRIQKGRGGPSRNPAEIGSAITILYDSENPKRNAPYPLSLVRRVR